MGIRVEIPALLMSELKLSEKAEQLDKLFFEEEATMDEVGHLKSYIQKEALNAVLFNKGRGLIAMATGTGKSKIPLDYIKLLMEFNDSIPKVLLAVPTEKLRDENWKEEFEKWGLGHVWEYVRRECYVSLHKIEREQYDLVIFDEAHNITESNSTFLSQNRIDRLIALTATEPENELKKWLLEDAGLKTVYTVSLDIAVKMRLVSPYEITIIDIPLNNVDKDVQGGSKAKPFMQTEQAAYNYLDNQCTRMMSYGGERLKFKLLARMRMVYNLKSKTEAAKHILKLIPRTERVLTFCGSIQQAFELGDMPPELYAYFEEGADMSVVPKGMDMLTRYTFHSKTKDTWFTKFKAQEIDRLTCVNSLNEGHTIEGLDVAVVAQLNSKQLHFVQRIGRMVRFRMGHTAKIFVLCAIGTQDESWIRKAMLGLDQSKIKRVKYEDIVNGNYKLYEPTD